MYSDYELDMYAFYMDEVRDIVNASNLPAFTKKKMCEGETLIKNNNDVWSLRYKKGESIDFISFNNWMKREERIKKLKQLGL